MPDLKRSSRSGESTCLPCPVAFALSVWNRPWNLDLEDESSAGRIDADTRLEVLVRVPACI